MNLIHVDPITILLINFDEGVGKKIEYIHLTLFKKMKLIILK